MAKVHVKAKDQVVVLSGDEKIRGKQGKVLTVYPKTGRVVVEGVGEATKHKKPRRQGEPGGIITVPRPIDASNVMLICPKCDKPTRVGHRIELVEREDGSKKKKIIRVCKKCKADID